MSSSLLWRTQVAVLPADRNGLNRVGVYLRLMDKAAFDASQLSRTNAAWIAMLSFFVTGNASAQDAKLALALNNVQSEMSDCLAYYANIKACVS
jgi:hypothetical protein